MEDVLNQYLKPVYNFVFRMIKNEDEAEDVVQETFIKIWTNLPRASRRPSLTLREGSDQDTKSLKPWIFTIARNTTIDHLRKKRSLNFSELSNENEGDFFEDNLQDENILPDEILMNSESAEELEKALDQIRPDFKEVLLLHYMGELTFEEISKIVGKPANTVKSHHRRGLSALRNVIT